MLIFLSVYILSFLVLKLYCFSSITDHNARLTTLTHILTAAIEPIAFDDIIPFLSEHIQLSDQMLVIGAKTDLSLRLVKLGYGTKKTGSILVVDSDPMLLAELASLAGNDEDIFQHIKDNKLSFKCVDLTNMPEVCKQSVFDSIVDCKGIDSVLNGPHGKQGMLKCIDHLQNAVRLGNILVSLSESHKNEFCSVFEERFGWLQELDGDPGDISAWYRGKTNIQATKSKFQELGLKMYVYTNTDNC